MLHLETVQPDTLALLKRIQALPLLSETRLVGGTALAFHFAQIENLAAMKLEAVNNRGSKKDFIDVVFLLELFSLKEMLDLYQRKYPAGLKLLVMRSLVYFDDAETTDMPVMLKSLSWDEAKARICDAVRATA